MATIASLFSGGGLVEAGAIAASYRPIWGVEFDPSNPKLSSAIADHYEKNIGVHIIRRPVQEVKWSDLEPPDVLWASPVCKQFSTANANRNEGEQDLSSAIAVQKAIEILQPKVFCLENVRAYQKSKSLQIIRDTLFHLDYGVSEEIVNSADYGVPQSRDRLFLRAVKGHFPPAFPLPLSKRVGWYEAIADLIPELPESKLAPWQQEKLPLLLCSTLIDGRNGDINTGVPTLRKFSEPSFSVTNAYLIERSGARSDRDLLVRRPDEPSWTLRASIGTDQNGSNRHDAINAVIDGRVARLTPRALARLQSVPDWYQLPDEICVAGPLLGNGVPSKLAQIILEGLMPYVLPKEKLVVQEPEYETIGRRLPDGSTQQPIGKLKSNKLQRFDSMFDHTVNATPVDENVKNCTNNIQVEVVEDLTPEEEDERCRLELRVEKSFYECGVALRELRDRKLYRSTHKTFEEYCRDRFALNRSRSYQFIDAACVVDNLSKCPRFVDILPTNEFQCRPLTSLKEKEQQQVWGELLEQTRGKRPTAAQVKKTVKQQKSSTKQSQAEAAPPSIPYTEGDVVMIRGMGDPELRKYDGQWAIAIQINEYSVTVHLGGEDIPVRPQFLEEVDPEYWMDIKSIHERIAKLQQCNLDPLEDDMLESLRRRTCFTEKQKLLLARMEQDYKLI